MRLTFLGTGGGLPSPQRGVSALAIQRGREVLLFDCGEGTQRQFMCSTVSFMKINNIFISHFHGDHILGLPGLVQSMNFSGRTTPLSVYGPPGIVDLTRTLIHIGNFAPCFTITAAELAHGSVVDLNGCTVTAVAGEHTLPELGYVVEEKPRRGQFLIERARSLNVPEGPLFSRLQAGQTVEVNGRSITPDMVLGPPRRGRKIAISGDTRPTDAMIQAARDADVLVHEATLDSSLSEGAAEYGHSTARQAAEVASRADVHELYLTHISNRYEDASVLLEEAKVIFPNSHLAEDLLTVEVHHHS